MQSVRGSAVIRKAAVSAVVTLSAAALTLRAQVVPAPVPAPASQPTTNPTSAPGGSSTRPASTRPASTQPGDDAPKPAEKISLNFKDAPLDAVLDYMSSAAGFVVVKEGAVEGRVSVTSKQPVTPEVAVTLLSAVLKSNGLTAIQEGRVLRVIARDKAKKGSVPVYFGSDPEAISPTDELITQVIQLRNVDAVKLMAELKPMLNPEADVTATASSNAIIITDSSSAIRRLAKIIKSLDGQEASSSDILVRQLKFANAAAAAKLLGEVFKGGGGGGMSPQQMMMMQQQGQPVPPGGGGAREGVIPGGAIDQALRGGRVTASADERTNTIVITAPTATLKVIEGLLDQLDENPAAGSSEIRVFPLTYANAEDTSKLITSIFKGEDSSNNDFDSYYYGFRRGGNQDAALKVKVEAAFDERTNSVIVTAPKPTLDVIDDLIKKLDANPVATADLKVFHLKNADSFDVSFLLEDIFKPKDDEQQGDGFFRFVFLGGEGQGQKAPKMTAVSDDRTNSVIVTAPSEMLKAIGDVINELDTNPVSEEDLFIYRLRNAQSANLEFVLNQLFGNISQPGQNQNQDGNNQGQEQFQNRNNNGGGNRDRNRNRNNGRGGSNRAGNDRQNRNMPQMTPGLNRAVTELTGKVFVVADVDTNSLLVTTASRYRDQVKTIIDELDRPVPQVLIKVLVAEVTHNDGLDYGVDFSILNRRPSGLGQTFGTNFGNAAAGITAGGLVVSVLEKDVTATLHALSTDGKLDVLSRPYILASDNQLASILVGQEVPLIQNTRQSDEGVLTNSFDYRDVGIILDVTPHINPDGQVILDVAPEISALSDSEITVSPGVAAPVINVRSAESRVEVKTGQTIVIGGLMEDRKNSTVRKVPLLGDIPLIGEAFRRTQTTKVKTELLIFLTPHVAENVNGLEDMTADEVQGTKLTPNAVEPGMFQEHIRNMKHGAMPMTQPTGGNGAYISTTPPDRRDAGASTRPADVSIPLSPRARPEPAPETPPPPPRDED